MDLFLSAPSKELLPSFIACLKEGPFLTMQLNFARATAEEVEKDPDEYLRRVTDKKPFIFPFRGKNYEISEHELLWLHDGTRFIGTVALRYDGDQELLMNWVGHIGMAVRPSLLQKGYGIKGLLKTKELILDRFREKGFKAIRAACHPDNRPSRRLIEYFGGKRLPKDDKEFLLFEISLPVE